MVIQLKTLRLPDSSLPQLDKKLFSEESTQKSVFFYV